MWNSLFYFCLLVLSLSPAFAQKQVAFTIDDLPMTGAGNRVNLAEIIACNDNLLAQAQRYGVPVIGFVNEKRILVKGEMEARTEILRMWLERGAALGQYLVHTGKMIAFYERLTTKTIGRPIPHIYLCHDNELHADHFGGLVEVFRKKGYEFISMEEALKDEVYQSKDDYVGRMGISWLHRWNTENRMELFRQEPDPEPRILELFETY